MDTESFADRFHLDAMASTAIGTATAVQLAEDVLSKALAGTITALVSAILLRVLSYAWAKFKDDKGKK